MANDDRAPVDFLTVLPALNLDAFSIIIASITDSEPFPAAVLDQVLSKVSADAVLIIVLEEYPVSAPVKRLVVVTDDAAPVVVPDLFSSVLPAVIPLVFVTPNNPTSFTTIHSVPFPEDPALLVSSVIPMFFPVTIFSLPRSLAISNGFSLH